MDSEHAKKLLIRKRDRLQSLRDQVHSSGELDQSQQESSGELSAHDQHIADSATDTFQRELDESIEDRLEGEKRDIDAALERIENDEYGICDRCGRPIPDERLEALPATRYCREHASSGEATEAPGMGWEIAQELGENDG